MITHANKELIRRFVREVFVEGRIESVDELVADDFVSHTWGPAGSGKEDLNHAMTRLAGALADVEFVVDDMVAEAGRVAVRLTASATQVGEFMGRPPGGRRYTIGEIASSGSTPVASSSTGTSTTGPACSASSEPRVPVGSPGLTR